MPGRERRQRCRKQGVHKARKETQGTAPPEYDEDGFQVPRRLPNDQVSLSSANSDESMIDGTTHHDLEDADIRVNTDLEDETEAEEDVALSNVPGESCGFLGRAKAAVKRFLKVITAGIMSEKDTISNEEIREMNSEFQSKYQDQISVPTACTVCDERYPGMEKRQDRCRRCASEKSNVSRGDRLKQGMYPSNPLVKKFSKENGALPLEQPKRWFITRKIQRRPVLWIWRMGRTSFTRREAMWSAWPWESTSGTNGRLAARSRSSAGSSAG